MNDAQVEMHIVAILTGNDLTRREIHNRINATPQQIERALTRLRRNNVIEITNRGNFALYGYNRT